MDKLSFNGLKRHRASGNALTFWNKQEMEQRYKIRNKINKSYLTTKNIE